MMKLGGMLWLLLLGVLPMHAAGAARGFFLEADVAIERGGSVKVFFDYGDGPYEENSATANVPPGTQPQTVRLSLPSRPIRALRFDPVADDAPVFVGGLRLVDERGATLLTIDPHVLQARHQIERIVPEGAGVRIFPAAKADDPVVRFDFGPLQKRLHAELQRATVGPVAVTVLAFVIAAVISIAVWAASRSLGRGGRLATLGVFCVVFGARLAWLHAHARPVPFWDEWEGDALYILVPFTGGFLDWGALVMPQWEHRIVVTRVIALFGTLVNGEWDPRVAMAFSAAMFATMITLISSALLAVRSWWGVAAAVLLATWATLPFDFNNLLWGGQTQMYALVLMVVCITAIAATPRVTRVTPLVALVAGVISLFTMGAGPVAPGCAVGICLLRAWFEREQRRALLSFAAVFFVTALLGVCLHVSSRQHVPLYATSFAQFWRCFVGVLSWPLRPQLVCALLLWLPTIANAAFMLRRRGATPLEWLAVGLGGWSLINATALGYARQYEGPPFDSRFFTPIAVGALASLCSSVALLNRLQTRTPRVLLALGAAAVGVGLLVNGFAGITGARENALARTEHDRRIRHFLATGNPAPLLERAPASNGEAVVERLATPALQRILPAAYRRAIAQRENGNTPTARIEVGPLTAITTTLMRAGGVFAALGAVILGVSVYRMRRGLPRPLQTQA